MQSSSGAHSQFYHSKTISLQNDRENRKDLNAAFYGIVQTDCTATSPPMLLFGTGAAHPTSAFLASPQLEGAFVTKLFR